MGGVGLSSPNLLSRARSTLRETVLLCLKNRPFASFHLRGKGFLCLKECILAKIRKCRNCKKPYKRSAQHPGCCSDECYRVRRAYLKNSPKPLPIKRINVSGIKDPFVLSRKSLDKMQAKAQGRFGDSFYTSRAWLSLRYKVIMKYGRMCAICKAMNVEIHVDHIKPRSKFPHLELDINNLQVLCKDCNLGKGCT